MSQLADIKTAQENLEEIFCKRMADLEAQLHTGGPAKDTVAKVAEEFRSFRELMFSMFKLLRQQINECSRTIDIIETRHRRKALVFLGVPETAKEDCRASVLKIVHNMELPNVSTSDVNECHRLGAPSNGQHRPILAWFCNVSVKSAIWRAKTKLKGTSVSVKEFLTKPRQLIFTKARLHFGVRSCWTQDGVIVVKTPDGRRHKITIMEKCSSLMLQHSKISSGSSTAEKSGAGNVGTLNPISKQRK